jgi:hypothetical protein
MQNISRLPLCQGAFSKLKNYKKANNPVNHGRIELRNHEISKENIHRLEELSIVKAKEALTKNLLTPREVIQVFSNLEAAREANSRVEVRRAHSNSRATFPAPATSNPPCGFPATGFPLEFRIQVYET